MDDNDKSVGLVALAEKSKAGLSNMNNPVIVVKPKDATQTCSTTKTDIRMKIDPSGHPICAVRNVSKGGFVIERASKNASIALQNDFVAKLGSNYNVNIPGNK